MTAWLLEPFSYAYMFNAMWVSALVGGVCAFLSAYLMLKGRSMPKIGPFDPHISHHRAWPWDTDAFGELNNGRILTLFELGRWQAAVRMGMIHTFLKEGYMVPIAGASIRYRKRVTVIIVVFGGQGDM